MSEISDLMAKDPLNITKEDRTKIISFYRAGRQNFMNGIKAPKEAKPKEPKGPVAPLSLDDLEL